MTQFASNSSTCDNDVERGHEPLVLTGSLRCDLDCLRQIETEIEQALARLPTKSDRSPADHKMAENMLEQGRTVRETFLQRHAQEVYDLLTDQRQTYMRLDELLKAVAQRFPGLAPNQKLLHADRIKVQAHKEGFEIDLGLIVRAFMRIPDVGSHLMDAMLRPTARALSLLPLFLSNDRIDLGSVLLERRNQGGHLTLQSAENLNAEDETLVNDLETAIDLVLLDDRIRVGALRGGVMTHPKYAGRRIFCAGINLKSLRDGKIGLIDFLLTRELGLVNKLQCGVLSNPQKVGLERLEQKPWVAAVEGFAIGGGMQLLLVSDYVIAATDSYFSLPAANEGIVPGAANLRISRQLGSRLSRRIILSGKKIKTSDPEAWLICDEIVPSEVVDKAVENAVEALSSPAVTANRMMLNRAEERPEDFRIYMAEFAVVQARRAFSADVLAKLDHKWDGKRGSP